jgi:hypothetical protein
MAIVKRKFSPQMQTLAAQVNTARNAAVGANIHRDASERIVTAATANSPSTAVTLANDIRRIYAFHAADDVAHKAADGTNVTALAACHDDTTCIALVLALALAYEAHRVSTSVHDNADSTHSLTSTTVTTIGQAETVATDMKAKLNLHLAAALAGKSVRLVKA